MKLTVWLRCLENMYFAYVNRFLVVVGDVTTNELKRQCVGIEKSVGVEWSEFRFFSVMLCERQHVEAFEKSVDVEWSGFRFFFCYALRKATC
jgi:hypothetical protein